MKGICPSQAPTDEARLVGWRRRVRCVCLFVAALLALSGAIAQARERLDVAAMLRLAEFGDPIRIDWRGYEPHLAEYSPDGSRVTVVVRRGDPAAGGIEADLLLYRTADLWSDATPQPALAAHVVSQTKFQPIAAVSWIDAGTLQFAASQGTSPTQIVRLDLATGTMTPVTRETRQMIMVESAPGGDRLIVFAEAPASTRPEEDATCLVFGCRVIGQRLDDALLGVQSWHEYDARVVVYDVTAQTRREVRSPFGAPDVARCSTNLAGGISPDGRFGLVLCMMRTWPSWWADYPVDLGQQRAIATNEPSLAVRQYFVLDFDAGTYRPLTGAPRSWRSAAEPIWVEGGRQVILAGALAPLEGASPRERRQRAEALGILSVDLVTGRVTRIATLPHDVESVDDARWNASLQTLTIESTAVEERQLPARAWRYRRGAWTETAAAPVETPPQRPVELILEQSSNAPPLLYAESTETQRRRLVLNPNAWLSDYDLGQVEEVNWTSRSGRTWSGSLYLPPDYRAGQRYPLVIQTHGDGGGAFAPYGYARNFAAQPLASEGIVVLQAGLSGGRGPEEWSVAQEAYEGAIDYLDGRGLIDRARVGALGWSRTANHLEYVITHSDYPFAALLLGDGNDFGWWTYMNWGVHQEIERNYGAEPFGAGLEQMLEYAPTFNLHRWRTPTLMWSAGNTPTPFWDVHVGLRRLQRPEEYWIVPGGDHDPLRMSHRLRINTLVVDWFAFWLAGRERSDVAPGAGETLQSLAEQYARWRRMHEQQQRVLSEPRPPLLDWTATPVERRAH